MAMADRLWRRVEEAEQELGIARAAFDALPAEERKAVRALAKAAEKEKLIAAKTELDTMPAEEFWARFERVGQLLHLQGWKFAKTMASNPHFYTLRRNWPSTASDDLFVWTVEQLRLRGYRQRYPPGPGGAWYIALDVNDWFYWTMGSPLHNDEKTGTILINRKRGSGQADKPAYDAIADQYDALFQDEASLAEKAQVFGIVRDLMPDRDVLDVGCGTGLVLDYAELAGSYTGIDPSRAMLDRLLVRHPNAQVICTSLASFMPPSTKDTIARYDLVLALFGVGGYLTDRELARIPLLLRSGGHAVVMFCAAHDVPPTGITVPHRPWALNLFPGEIRRIGRHILCLYERR
jgi:2-polyprenyl-3-methyl-5-hydroxy-6-metoxy-1,4-benzoquinol methylase